MKSSSGIAILLLVMWAPRLYPDKPAAYIGSKQCEVCHSDISAAWLKTRHAKAVESLRKSEQESLPACVKCHVTGYERDGGFIDYELTPEMAGVQCESCHGPGSNHAADSSIDMLKNGGAELCRQCHTEGQDPRFEFEEKVKEVHRVPQ